MEFSITAIREQTARHYVKMIASDDPNIVSAFIHWARWKVKLASHKGNRQCYLFPDDFSKTVNHDPKQLLRWLSSDASFHGFTMVHLHRRCGFQSGILIGW